MTEVMLLEAQSSAACAVSAAAIKAGTLVGR